ncbi:MAG: carboxylesterase/lipase family protein [Granulicella sp.]
MNWNTAKCVGSALLAAMVAVSAAPAWAADANDLQVKTKQGKVEGRMEGTVKTFLGIPFAAPPVGPLRWKPPMPAEKWSGVKQTKGFGYRCMQPAIYHDMMFRDAGMSEDCLTLNVWTPAKDEHAKLPVMVWIYGGGYTAGSTSERRQDGAALTKNGVIVVTMNYRMNVFGFFANEELAKESGKNAAGNYGLMDQTAALQWVKDNIEAFGGDPNNVTLFGESAGSFSVSAQMASPMAKGLFKRVIGESGGALYSAMGVSFKPLADAAAKNDAFAQSVLGVTTLDQLRAIPASELLEDISKKNSAGMVTRFGPNVDGLFLAESPAAIFAAGKQNDVPMLAGWNRDEGGFDPKVTVESFKASVEKQFPEHAAELLALNPVTDDASAVRASADLAGDRFIAYSTWKWMEAQKATGKQPVYRYRFDQVAPPDPDHKAGLAAYHSSEIMYVFGDLDLVSSIGFHFSPEDHQTSTAMQKYWTNFAKNGDPNGDGLPKWPAYGPTEWQVMHLGPEPMAAPDTHRKQDLLLDSIWAK